MLRSTYTYVLMELSDTAYKEIYSKMRDAGYDHAMHKSDSKQGLVIDMHGIAVVKKDYSDVRNNG